MKTEYKGTESNELQEGPNEDGKFAESQNSTIPAFAKEEETSRC
jgi:hypothetical protein